MGKATHQDDKESHGSKSTTNSRNSLNTKSPDPFNDWLDLYDWIILVWTWLLFAAFQIINPPLWTLLILLLIDLALFKLKKHIWKRR